MRRALLLTLLAAACVGPTDDPSQVVDLRVLGVRIEPPEVMAEQCSLDDPLKLFATFNQELQVTWRIADPKGMGRAIAYEVRACADQGDLQCNNEGEFVVLGKGEAHDGELTLPMRLGAQQLADKFLLQGVLEQDTFKGLGGLRVPIVIHLTAGTEDVYAQKLMVFSCRFFPEMKVNVTPQLPGMTLDGKPWEADAGLSLSGAGPFVMLPVDFTDAEEPYVVPSLKLEPVHLVESWKIAWYATAGKFSPNETGGVDFSGLSERHRTQWKPKSDDVEQDVRFTFVVRDGRGGQSWLERIAHWAPDGGTP
ncbi:MAG: hypothetical protein K1X89_08730 [Myxococcaceae bacterium]|nr:hypothetical protein [Myxococcaceae bacterium]